MNTIFVKPRKLFLKMIKLKFVSNILNYYIRRYFYIFFIYDNLTFTIILVHGSFKTKIQMRVSQTPRHRLNFEFEITLVSSSMCFLCAFFIIEKIFTRNFHYLTGFIRVAEAIGK